MPSEPDLDATIDALAQAVAAGDREAIDARLAAIEPQLQAMNPLLRGMTYAHVQSVLGRPDRAVAVIEDLLELMPDDGRVCYQLGCYRRAAGDDDGALAAFTRATELDGALVDAWIHRGMLLDGRGESQLAIEAYRHVILRAPAEVDGWRNLGNSLAALGCFDEALEAYRTATRLAPSDDTLAFLIASTHQAMGDVAQANAGLPQAMRQELGPVVELRAPGPGPDLRCRLHVPQAREAALRAAADELLAAVRRELGPKRPRSLPHARTDSFVIEHGGVLLLCDVDPLRPGLPHRFFDATGVVERAAIRRR
ncbi:MAG: tetratricopeptide repeat protein [Myxococcales bacterium]|nr:tetratricopeptide repeat protein [Myxococcales bacterium]